MTAFEVGPSCELQAHASTFRSGSDTVCDNDPVEGAHFTGPGLRPRSVIEPCVVSRVHRVPNVEQDAISDYKKSYHDNRARIFRKLDPRRLITVV